LDSVIPTSVSRSGLAASNCFAASATAGSTL